MQAIKDGAYEHERLLDAWDHYVLERRCFFFNSAAPSMPHGGPADSVLYLSAWMRSQLLGSATLSLLGLIYVPQSRQLVVFVFSVLVFALDMAMNLRQRGGLYDASRENEARYCVRRRIVYSLSPRWLEMRLEIGDGHIVWYAFRFTAKYSISREPSSSTMEGRLALTKSPLPWPIFSRAV
jgi:hypothetical protein